MVTRRQDCSWIPKDRATLNFANPPQRGGPYLLNYATNADRTLSGRLDAARPETLRHPRYTEQLGARLLAGMQTAFIRRGPWGYIWEHHPDMAAAADWRVTSLTELPPIVAEVNRSEH